MFFIDILACVLLIFLTYFVFQSIAVVFYSSRGRLFDIYKKDSISKFQQNLTVIIYSHNNSDKVKELIELLNNQDYDKNKYSVNILLDNCNDENIKLLEILGGTKLWRINTDVKPIGKFKALSWLFERIMACENTNAFVFLSADCKIKTDFLQKVNSSVYYYPAIVGEVIRKKNKFLNRISNFRNKLRYRIIKQGRVYQDLGNFIESEILVIRQELLEKIKFNKTDFGFEEYQYPISLIKKKVPVFYSSEVMAIKPGDETFFSIAYKDCERRYKSLITFKNNFGLLFTNTSRRTKELILSLIYPSNTAFVLLNIFLIIFTQLHPKTIFAGIVNVNYIYSLLILKFLADLYSMLTLKCNINDYGKAVFLFFFTPFLWIKSILISFLNHSYAEEPKKKQNNKSKSNASKLRYEKHTVDASVTNGKQEFPCTMEIVKTDDYSQASFIFRGKKLVSSKYQRINYAVEELTEKLKSHGFAIKICSNCGYFYMTESTAAHSEGEQGYCLYKNYKEGSKEKEYSCVWDGCFNIIPSQAREHILNQVGVEKFKHKK